MCVAPGFWACATLNALRTTSGMIRALVRRAFHLVIGCMTPITSMYWWDSLCMRSTSPCPVSATSGALSRKASATPGDQVHGAGPESAEADAGAAGQAAVDVGHVGAALLMAHGHELHRGAREGLVQVERLLARDPEDALHSLGLEAARRTRLRLCAGAPDVNLPVAHLRAGFGYLAVDGTRSPAAASSSSGALAAGLHGLRPGAAARGTRALRPAPGPARTARFSRRTRTR